MSSGIYIHFPFCRSKCNYCAFHSSSKFIKEKLYYERLFFQIENSFTLFDEDNPSTLYFGGGTPSLFDLSKLKKTIELYTSRYSIEEVTLESNPADINENIVKKWKSIGINRLSIGVQSLDDDVLKFLGRRHSEVDVYTALDTVSKYFDNYSIDFMIGLPNINFDFIKLQKLLDNYKISHLSVYGLSIEEGTPFYKSKVEIDGDQFSEEFLAVNKFLVRNGYEHYEISNYCKTNLESKHNSKYWDRSNYLGLGVSAHSMWNFKRFYFDDNFYEMGVFDLYNQSDVMNEDEILDEYLMLSLRKNEGVPLKFISNKDKLNVLVEKNFIEVKNHKIYFTPLGWTVFNSIFVELFL